MTSFLAGLGTGLSLIVAIGAQNAFVLRQGLARLYPDQSTDEVLAGWTPYRTLAARYLWADNHRVKAGGEPIG